MQAASAAAATAVRCEEQLSVSKEHTVQYVHEAIKRDTMQGKCNKASHAVKRLIASGGYPIVHGRTFELVTIARSSNNR